MIYNEDQYSSPTSSSKVDELIKENQLTPSELKNLVTSPGGTTISALRVLEKKSVRSALIESIVSACNRSKEFN